MPFLLTPGRSEVTTDEDETDNDSQARTECDGRSDNDGNEARGHRSEELDCSNDSGTDEDSSIVDSSESDHDDDSQSDSDSEGEVDIEVVAGVASDQTTIGASDPSKSTATADANTSDSETPAATCNGNSDASNCSEGGSSSSDSPLHSSPVRESCFIQASSMASVSSQRTNNNGGDESRGSTTANSRGDSHRSEDNLGPGEQGQRHGTGIAIYGSNNNTGSNNCAVDVAALAISQPVPAPQALTSGSTNARPAASASLSITPPSATATMHGPLQPVSPPPPHYAESAIPPNDDIAAQLEAAVTARNDDEDNGCENHNKRNRT